jgi:hypothetical protein
VADFIRERLAALNHRAAMTPRTPAKPIHPAGGMGASVGAGPEDNSTGSETEKSLDMPPAFRGDSTDGEFLFNCDGDTADCSGIPLTAGVEPSAGILIF